MSRKSKLDYKIRVTPKDSVFKSILATKMINYIMQDGKKELAKKIFYTTINNLNKDLKEGFNLFLNAIEVLKPLMETKSRRIGGATFQVPIPVRKGRGEVLAMKWILYFAKLRKEYTIIEKLTNEIKDVNNGIGNSIKKRDELIKTIEVNRAFTFFK